MRVQPGMTVIAPADHRQTGAARCAPPGICPGRSTTGSARTTARWSRGSTGASRSAALETVRDGDDVVLVAIGSIAERGGRRPPSCWRRAACEPRCSWWRACSPAPVDDLVAALARVPLAVTVEAHYVNGGLGSLVAEVHRRARPRLPPGSLRGAHGHRTACPAASATSTTRTGSPRARSSRTRARVARARARDERRRSSRSSCRSTTRPITSATVVASTSPPSSGSAIECELVLVPNACTRRLGGDLRRRSAASTTACASVDIEVGGWGRAVRRGLARGARRSPLLHELRPHDAGGPAC